MFILQNNRIILIGFQNLLTASLTAQHHNADTLLQTFGENQLKCPLHNAPVKGRDQLHNGDHFHPLLIQTVNQGFQTFRSHHQLFHGFGLLNTHRNHMRMG